MEEIQEFDELGQEYEQWLDLIEPTLPNNVPEEDLYEQN